MDPVLQIVYLYTFLQGCIVGSFLNVVIDRLPGGESLAGRSHCDACRRTLGPLELIPVISYFAQGTRTRCCRVALKMQYPLVELLTGLLFLLTASLYVTTSKVAYIGSQDIAVILSLCVIMATTIAMSGVDFRHHVIPDVLQIALVLAAFAYRYLTDTLTAQSIVDGFVVALPILLLYLATRGRGMGFGDVKLEVGLGVWLGIGTGLLGIYAGFLFGSVYGIYLMVRRRAHRRSPIAFGPFLLLGAWTMYWWGAPVLAFYLRLLPHGL